MSEQEGRLDDMLCRVAMETQEIRELERQLTQGQTLVNEALQRDLNGIFCGLQEYLRGLREQAQDAQRQVLSLQAENQKLQRHLEDVSRRHRQDMSEARALRDRQLELEAELQQLREELTRQVTVGQQTKTRRDPLQQDHHHRTRKLRQLGRKTRDQLRSTVRQLRALNATADLLHSQRDELDGSSRQDRDTHTVELAAAHRQTHRLRQRLDQIRSGTRSGKRVGDGGQRIYISEGQTYRGSPDGGQQRGGFWLPVPPTHPTQRDRERTSSGGGGSSTGGTPPPAPPAPPPPPETRVPLVCVCRGVRQVCDEVQCVEKTLLRRRAELRRADKLLLEAQSCTRTTRDQADEWRRRAQDSATRLLETARHARELQEEVGQLSRSRREEEQALRSREEDFRPLAADIQSATDRWSQKRQDSDETQRREELHAAVREARENLQRLHSTVQELSEQKEVLLRERRSTASALQSEVNAHRAELKQLLQELEEVKTKLGLLTQEEEEQIRGKEDERADELQKKKKKQEEVARKREELAALQQEVESQRKEAESSRKNTEPHRTQLRELQEELSRRRAERRSLQQQCQHLEARRRHAHRCLSAVEVELTKQREEHSHAHPLKQEVVRDAAATQDA